MSVQLRLDERHKQSISMNVLNQGVLIDTHLIDFTRQKTFLWLNVACVC